MFCKLENKAASKYESNHVTDALSALMDQQIYLKKSKIPSGFLNYPQMAQRF